VAKRRDPGQKEYNPLDDARGRLPIDIDLVRDVMGATSPATAAAPAAVAHAPAPAPAAIEPEPDEEAQGKPLSLERLTKYNKFLTTPTEKLELERLAARISGALGVSVRPSHLIRACLIYMLHAENEIIRRADRHEQLKRPSNTEAVALAEFDQVIAEILSQAFREAGPLGSKQ
jgi:hypothetical protein